MSRPSKGANGGLQKAAVFQAVLTALHAEFESYTAISKKTRSAGNDAQTKAEGKYDTRSTEENYLADGQAKQALAARQALAALGSLTMQDFGAETPLAVGALVQLQFPGEKMWFLLAPAGGGLEVQVGRDTVTVLTLDSPLGAQLKGLKLGESTAQPAAKILAVL